MPNLGSQVYDLSMNAVVTLWEIDFTGVVDFAPSGVSVIRISPHRNGQNDISFGGNAYDYVGVDASGFKQELNGQLPNPTARFDRVGLNTLPDYVAIKADYASQRGQLFFDWRGATIRRTTVTAQYLDTGTEPDATRGKTEEYLVDQVTTTSVGTIEIKLTTSVTADRINNESVQSLAYNKCSLRYRQWNSVTQSFDYTPVADNGCPYGNPTSTTDWTSVPDYGTKYFNAENNPVAQELDVCAKTGEACQLRHDPDKNGLPLPIKAKLKRT